MKIYNEIDLYRYNTMKLHSIARIMYEPENVDELLVIFRKLKKEGTTFYLLSAGSNIVFGARIERPIVYLMSFNTNMSFGEDGTLECGASVRIQSLLEKMKEFSLGGIEYLASVPSSVGGAVYMNAGRGRKIKRSISDYIESVRYLDIADMQIKNMYGNDGYLYRSSPFQSLNAVILSARFKLIKQDVDITNRLIKERLAYSQRYLSADKPSCGSVFCLMNPVIMRLLRGTGYGGAIFSKKTSNWISNIDNAKVGDIEVLIGKAIRWHKVFFSKYKVEIRFFR